MTGSRLWRVVLVGSMGTTALFALLILPDVLRLIWSWVPPGLRHWWVEATACALVMACAITRRLASSGADRPDRSTRAGRVLARVDSLATYDLYRMLSILLGVTCGGFLAAWVPHYLTWPYSRDEDTFSVLAMSWDRGILPYRDIRAYNFPGETYLFWVLGKSFGWGRTTPFYVFDAGCVVLLGIVLILWSRRKFGGAVPGLFGYLAFLRFYLSQPFETTGERDWHTALLVCLGLMLSQAWPGRRSRIVSALAMAMAISIRPHAVLFLPALASAIAEHAPASATTWTTMARPVLAWAGWLVVFLVAAFAPLIAAGIADDWIRGLRVAAYGGPYSRVTPAGAMETFLWQFSDWRTDVSLAATLILASGRGGRSNRMARTWLLAWLGALVYRPIHPVPHMYLIHPFFLVASITWALPIDRLLSRRGLAMPVRILAVALLAYEVEPQPPAMCHWLQSARAVRTLFLGEMPATTPMGSVQAFGGAGPTAGWVTYCSVLTYLRESTRPQTFVANVLNRYPMESLNGPSGRLSPFLAESGICWLDWVKIDLDPEFARQLEATPDSVVVWDPRQRDVSPAMKLERVISVIRRDYEPEARFGHVEVWRRKPLHETSR
jgi:hypothetical protein